MPQWEHINTNFDIGYTDSKKSETANILAIQVGENLIKNYPNHIKKKPSGGSVLGSWSRIPHSSFKSAKIFLLKDGFLHILIGVTCNINGIKLHMQHPVSNI